MYSLKNIRLKNAEALVNSDFLNKDGYNFNAALLDIDILISFIIGKDREWILAHKEFDFKPHKKILDHLVKKRANGLPIAYIVKKKEFYNNSFYINKNVLIPKCDTEVLVEKACEFLNKKLKEMLYENKKTDFHILDICTGSGCIGISIAEELYSIYKTYIQTENNTNGNYLTENIFFKENFFLVLSDISNKALRVCKKNVTRILPKVIKQKTKIRQSDVTKKIPRIKNKQYELITANPPYVPSQTAKELLCDGRNEPLLALDGGKDGLSLIRPLAENCFPLLTKSGKLFIELGEYNIIRASEILKQTGFLNIKLHKDLSGQYRVIEACKTS